MGISKALLTSSSPSHLCLLPHLGNWIKPTHNAEIYNISCNSYSQKTSPASHMSLLVDLGCIGMQIWCEAISSYHVILENINLLVHGGGGT